MKVLDTDVCIEILRGNAAVMQARSRTLDQVVTTWITACELSYGAANSIKPQENAILVNEFLATTPVLECNLAAADIFGRHKASLRQAGQTVADADLMIAALTLSHAGTLITGNIKHYARIPDLRIEDWIRGRATSGTSLS